MIKYVQGNCAYCGDNLCLVEEGNLVFCNLTCLKLFREQEDLDE